ncbi:MAG: GNAT family N-acetyltransferase [Bacillota bacterium]
MINNLYKLTKKDIDKGAEITSKAFYDYPIFKYILGDKHTIENIKIVQRFFITYGVLYGEAYASSKNFEGVIVFTDFNKYKFNFFRLLRCGLLSLIRLGGDAGKKFNEFDEFTLKVHKEIIKDPHQYLMMIGVDPARQGQGFGSKLMLPMLEIAEKKGQPCYTETHGQKNVAMYKKYGFKVVCEDVVPGTDIVQYSMLKDK